MQSLHSGGAGWRIDGEFKVIMRSRSAWAGQSLYGGELSRSEFNSQHQHRAAHNCLYLWPLQGPTCVRTHTYKRGVPVDIGPVLPTHFLRASGAHDSVDLLWSLTLSLPVFSVFQCRGRGQLSVCEQWQKPAAQARCSLSGSIT